MQILISESLNCCGCPVPFLLMRCCCFGLFRLFLFLSSDLRFSFVRSLVILYFSVLFVCSCTSCLRRALKYRLVVPEAVAAVLSPSPAQYVPLFFPCFPGRQSFCGPSQFGCFCAQDLPPNISTWTNEDVAKFFKQIALTKVKPMLQTAWQEAADKMLTVDGTLYDGNNFDPPKFAHLDSNWKDVLPQALIGQLRVALGQFTGPSYLHL
mgnify:CR=1 FL=1